jgi:hypothetical protein
MVLDLVSPELAGEYRAKLDAAATAAGRPAPALAVWIPAEIDPNADSYAELAGAPLSLAAPPAPVDISRTAVA